MSNSIQQKSHTKIISIILISIISIVAIVVYFGVLLPQKRAHDPKNIKIDGVFLTTPQQITTFHLTDNFGKDFTQQNLKGHWTMLFFGFTNCGMVCPTTLSSLNQMYKLLQNELPDNKLPQVVFVTVDPERDTKARMNEYLSSFNPHFIGVRGTNSETAMITNQLHIAAVKMQAEGQGKDQYSINHTAEVLVVNPDGQLQALLSYPHTAEQLVKDYKALLMSV